MAFKRTTRVITNELNITNLVDVIFCLLIVFMIAAPLMSQGVKVDLPRTKAKNIDVNETVRVTIDRRRKIYIGDEQVSFVFFDREFKKEFPGPETPVILNADRSIPYGFVVEVINKLQRAGVEKLSFLTEMPNPEEQP